MRLGTADDGYREHIQSRRQDSDDRVLSMFADEVTRVVEEVTTEGKLEGQACVANVGGT